MLYALQLTEKKTYLSIIIFWNQTLSSNTRPLGPPPGASQSFATDTPHPQRSETLKVCPDDAQLFSLGQGTMSHGALFHAVPGCCKCFQQCRIAGSARVGTLGSYPTLLEALATPWDSVEQCSMGTLSLIPKRKVASSGPTFNPLLHEFFFRRFLRYSLR